MQWLSNWILRVSIDFGSTYALLFTLMVAKSYITHIWTTLHTLSVSCGAVPYGNIGFPAFLHKPHILWLSHKIVNVLRVPWENTYDNNYYVVSVLFSTITSVTLEKWSMYMSWTYNQEAENVCGCVDISWTPREMVLAGFGPIGQGLLE